MADILVSVLGYYFSRRYYICTVLARFSIEVPYGGLYIEISLRMKKKCIFERLI